MGMRMEIEVLRLDPPGGVVSVESADTAAVDGLAFSGWLELMMAVQTLVAQETDLPGRYGSGGEGRGRSD
jgi:hypothetical protein